MMPLLITGDEELVELGDEMHIEFNTIAELSWSSDEQLIDLRRIESGRCTEAKVARVGEFLKDLTIPKDVYVREALIAAGIITENVPQGKPHAFGDKFDVGIFLKASGITIEKLVDSIAAHVQKDIDERQEKRKKVIDDCIDRIKSGKQEF